MGHQPRVEFTRFTRRETVEQIALPRGDRLRPVDSLVADDEMALFRGSAREGAAFGQPVQKGLRLCLDLLPRRGGIWLEQHPARALLDARRDE